MVHEQTTTLAGDEVLDRAIRFFTERVPHHAAFPEQRGAAHLVLRGQGGEEVTIAVFPHEGHTRVRASTLFFDQALARFLHTLPGAGEAAA